ncbi:MAG: cysteine--tRNA ligase [Candidatus Thorarchaeota archaeon]
MTLKLYNSLTRKKEEFVPIFQDKILMYSCGMTVQNEPHIGHLRTYTFWDILKKYLRFKFPTHKIIHVQNYTDVGHLTDDADQGEDKIINEANKFHTHPLEITDKYTRIFEEVLKDLDIEFPLMMPRATAHITEMIDLIQILLEKGVAYITENGIYFDISKYTHYTELTGINLDEQHAGARIEKDEYKRNHYDFALFIKARKDHILQWPTPWGWKGYPGWHIECTGMALKYLGDKIDIHTGGIEHLSIHHPNERAQTETITGKKWVNFWIHANHMMLEGSKMAKSTGHYISARNAVNTFGKDFLKYYLVTGSHYQSQEDITDEKITKKRIEFLKIQTIFGEIYELQRNLKTKNKEFSPSEESQKFQKDFILAMDDNLNTPNANSILLKFSGFLNREIENLKGYKSDSLSSDTHIFIELANLLGIKDSMSVQERMSIVPLLEFRDFLKSKKEYQYADELRNGINKLGFRIEDKRNYSIVIKEF